MKFSHQRIAFLLAITLGLSELMTPLTAIANLSDPTVKRASKKQIYVPVIGSSGKGSPSRRADAGSSSGSESCRLTNAKDYLVALVPEYENYALTTQGHPTFWFFVPFAANKDYKITFEIRDAQNPIYRSTIEQLPSLPGILKVSVPTSIKSLTENQFYTWIFQIDCYDSHHPSSTPTAQFFVNGKIQRVPVNADLSRQLGSATSSREKAAIYGQNGIWFEALTLLANLRCSEPGNPNITEDWKSLLESEGVRLDKHIGGDLASKPIASCPKNP